MKYAIQTQYFPKTWWRGARIVASVDGMSLVVDNEHATNLDIDHKYAASSLAGQTGVDAAALRGGRLSDYVCVWVIV